MASFDSLPNELVVLVADSLGGRELLSLILSAKRFYLNGDLMNRLYAAKVDENIRSFCVPESALYAAYQNQTPAFIGIVNAWLEKRKLQLKGVVRLSGLGNDVYIDDVREASSPFDRWKSELYNGPGVFGSHTSLLHVACRANSVEMVEFILSKGLDPLKPDGGGFTPLHIAAASGSTATMQLLLSLGVDVDIYASKEDSRYDSESHITIAILYEEFTPFHLAAQNNKMCAAEMLLNAGADHLATATDDNDALSLAVRGCASVELVHYLLELGYNRSSLCRALLTASCCGDAVRGRILLDAGACVSFNCIVRALSKDHLSMIELLADHKTDLLKTGAGGRSLLYFARSEAAAQILLEKDPRIVTVGSYKTGPLSHLRDPRPKADCDWENPEIDEVPLITFLIAKGCTVDGKTMLWAAKAGTLSLLEAFKKLHRPFMRIINVKNELGDTPLHLAMYIQSGYCVDWINFLLELGCDANAVNRLGETPLFYAFKHRRKDLIPGEIDMIIKLLLNAGADISARASHGSTPLHWALDNSHVQAAQFLIDAGAHICVFDGEGRTALHMAARHGYLDIIEKLKQKGVDISTLTKRGESVLHLAVGGALYTPIGNLSYLKLLACAVLGYENVSIEAQAKGKLTPLTGHLDLIRWLRRQGVIDPSLTDNKGRTAFDRIKLEAPRVTWSFLEGFNTSGTSQEEAELVDWVLTVLFFEMGNHNLSFEAFEPW